MSEQPYSVHVPEKKIDVVEHSAACRAGHAPFNLATDLEFSTDALESYAFSRWEPLIYDAMVLAASVEFADRTVARSPRGWARKLGLQIPVHDPARWTGSDVLPALHDAVGFLTGDYWHIEFARREHAAPSPSNNYLSLPVQTDTVLAFSDGLDSRAVAGILGKDLGGKLVRVRMGSKTIDRPKNKGTREPFTSVPYSISFEGRSKETSARSRGFKFAMVTALAAYLSNASKIALPESGQGAIGPALITVGHGYPDYRNHPLFTKRMERFANALLGTSLEYVFPRIWYTKGETLRAYQDIANDDSWAKTRSCWRSSQWSAVNGKLRQCGVCAACMLRRLSVHAAELEEQPDTYVCNNMTAQTLSAGLDPAFTRMSPAFEHYAIAGTLHLDHLADMARPDAAPALKRHAGLIAPALGLSASDAEQRLTSLIQRHAQEWKEFMESLGSESFVGHWTRSA